MKDPEPIPGVRYPNFLVIGAMKSGTTSLYHYLRAHPQVYMPDLKEVDFFTAELNWGKGWKWYARQFTDAKLQERALGEASTSYTKHPRYTGVPERIARHLPNVKLIYVLRNPIDRMRSHYQHNVALGEEKAPIEEALLSNPSYLDTSRYALQLERYLDHFPRERILLFSAEELRHQRVDTMRKVLTFLEVDPDAEISTLQEEFYKTEERAAVPAPVAAVRNLLKKTFPKSVGLWRGRFVPDAVKKRMGRKVGSQQAAKPTMSDATRERIREALADDLTRLRAHVGDDFDAWGLI